jgi:hypothetical protein
VAENDDDAGVAVLSTKARLAEGLFDLDEESSRSFTDGTPLTSCIVRST